MKNLLLIFPVFFVLIGCDNNTNQKTTNKADRLTQQSEEALNKRNYEEAERLLIESINIYTETDNEAKLAENYSALSTTQVLSGKLSQAVESLIALRGFYRHAADRNAELQTMLQIGTLHFKLGRINEALSILSESFNSSQLYQFTYLQAKAAMEIAAVSSAVNHHETASMYLKSAALLYRQQNDIPQFIETECALISSLLSLGRTAEAFDVYQTTVPLVQTNQITANKLRFFVKCGESFANAEEFSFAKSCFTYALTFITPQNQYQYSSFVEQLHIGLAELYFHNFSFEDAQSYFSKAYESARNDPDGIKQGYLLVRVADCIVKRAATNNNNFNDGSIRAIQLYEQSQTLFARSGLGFGEAIALHRLGLVRQLLNDDNAAITFYKRAFDKFSGNAIPPSFYALSVNLQHLCSSISQPNDIEFWFSDNLISLLLKYRKFPDALIYYESVRALKFQAELGRLHLQFNDKTKNNKYSELQKSISLKNVLQLELFHLNDLLKPNINYAGKLRQELPYLQSKIASEIVTLSQEFPRFSFLNGLQKSSFASIAESISPASTLLEYCFTGNECWVFIARNNEEITAVKLSSFGISLKERMDRFMKLFDHSPSQVLIHPFENAELYQFLFQPMESFSKQSIIIVPPIGMEKFPFHILTKNGRLLIDMMETTYLPSISFVQSLSSKNTPLQSSAKIEAFGFTTDSRWGLEFELRDIRSFFKTTQANVNQTATPEKLSSATGDLLHLSSPFQKNGDGEYSFLLSSGSTLKSGVSRPIENFAGYYPFPIVYLSDVQSTANNISPLHSLIWLLNGATSVIVTQFPITSNISKSFNENFYNSLSSDETPVVSYRKAVSLFEQKKGLYGPYAGASYFFYGVP